MDVKQLASALSGCPADALLGFRLREDGTLAVIVASGQKYVYTPEQVTAAQSGSSVLRAVSGQFVSPKDQDADGVPEIIKKAGKTKHGKGVNE